MYLLVLILIGQLLGLGLFTPIRGKETLLEKQDPKVVVPKGINTNARYELEDGKIITGYKYVSDIVKESGGDNTWHIRDASKINVCSWRSCL